jgi:hypothetical protein
LFLVAQPRHNQNQPNQQLKALEVEVYSNQNSTTNKTTKQTNHTAFRNTQQQTATKKTQITKQQKHIPPNLTKS